MFRRGSEEAAVRKQEPDDAELATAKRPTIRRAHPLSLLKLGGGGAVMAGLALMVALSSRHNGAATALLGVTATVLFVLFGLRWEERIEVDGDGLRCERRFRPFALQWRDVAAVRTRDDALGPFVLYMDMSTGKTHELARHYADWEGLVRSIVESVASARSSPPSPLSTLRDGPRVTASGTDATPVGRFVSALPSGTRLVDLREATTPEDLSLFDAVDRELAEAGPSSQLVVWIVPASAIATWNTKVEAVIDRMSKYSIARTVEGSTVANAFVVAGPCEPAPALSFLLQSLGMQLFKMAANDDPPVLEVALSDGRTIAGMTGKPVESL